MVPRSSPSLALALCALLAAGSAHAFQLGRATFSSVGGGPSGSAFLLGVSAGLPVAGGPSPAIAPTTEEGAGFWIWGRPATTGVSDGAPLVRQWALEPAAPNPFAHETRIRYAVPSASGGAAVQLRIYDLSGRLVRTLDSGWRAAGLHALTWDGRDDAGHSLGGGVYFCRVTAGSYAATRRLVLTR